MELSSVLRGLLCLFILSQCFLIMRSNGPHRHIKFGWLVVSVAVKFALCTAYIAYVLTTRDLLCGEIFMLIMGYVLLLFLIFVVLLLYMPCVLEYEKPYRLFNIRTRTAVKEDDTPLYDAIIGEIKYKQNLFMVRLDPDDVETLKQMGYVDGEPFDKELEVFLKSRQGHAADHVYYEAIVSLNKQNKKES